MSMHPYRYFAAAVNELIGRTAMPFTIELLKFNDASIRLKALLDGQALPAQLASDLVDNAMGSERVGVYWVGDRHLLGYVLAVVNTERDSPAFGEIVRAWAFPV